MIYYERGVGIGVFQKLTLERLLVLANEGKSVYWTTRSRAWPAAFFQNWNARHLFNAMQANHIIEITELFNKTKKKEEGNG